MFHVEHVFPNLKAPGWFLRVRGFSNRTAPSNIATSILGAPCECSWKDQAVFAAKKVAKRPTKLLASLASWALLFSALAGIVFYL